MSSKSEVPSEVHIEDSAEDRVPTRGVTPQPGRAEMHAVLSAALLAGELGQYR